MDKRVKYGLWFLAAILAALIVLWVALWVYISYNTNSLKQTISEKLNERLRGQVQIEKLSPSFLKTFPFISIDLSNVILRDSLYHQHKRDLLKAGHVYLRISPWSLASKKKVGRVIIRSADIYLITDSTEYSNYYILKTGDNGKQSNGEQGSLSYPTIELRSTTIVFDRPSRNKFHRAEVQQMVCDIHPKKDHIRISIKTRIHVAGLGFNLTKGSYLEDKDLQGKFDLSYDKQNHLLSFSNIVLRLDDHPFRFTGKFSLDKTSPDFDLLISANHINFTKAANLLPESARSKLNLYSLEKPVSFTVDIKGQTKYKSKPLVNVQMNVVENNVQTPFGLISGASFRSSFVNEVKAGQLRDDANSQIQISDVTGEWEGFKIRSKSITVSNLKFPHLKCDLSSSFNLTALNELTGSNTLKFTNGQSSLNIQFEGPIGGTDSLKSNINGDISLKDAAFEYMPRKLSFRNGNGSLRFRGGDLVVHKLDVQTGQTKLLMKGSAKNFLSMLNVSPEKLILSWSIHSPHLHLGDFKSFLSKQSTVSEKRSDKALFGETAQRIDKMFVNGDVRVSLTSPRVEYKKFKATDAIADILLTSTEIALNKVSLNHAKGSMEMKGSMKEAGGGKNDITMSTRMQKLDIPILFESFNNFGQDAITHENLEGQISANVNLSTVITDQATILKEKSQGTIDFLVENGELNNFEPLQKISEKAFKKQDFTHIKFADLKNRLTVKGTAFVMEKMEIRSTAINFSAEGIYDVEKGTDMSIIFPVKNLLKSNINTDISDRAKKSKGFSLRLRAKTGEDGKLKISWDPFRRSLRNKEEVIDSLPGSK